MQMHFHVADTEADHLRYAVEQFALVFFLRVKKAVLGALAGGISGSVVCNARPLIAPSSNTAKRSFHGCSHAQRLIVIRDGNPGALRPPGPYTPA
jgi:hypothetical protein